MNEFKFRAECFQDVVCLQQVFQQHGIPVKMLEIEKLDSRFPDVVVILKSADVKLLEIRRYMGMVADGHVMRQTVAEKNDYTGERNYDL